MAYVSNYNGSGPSQGKSNGGCPDIGIMDASWPSWVADVFLLFYGLESQVKLLWLQNLKQLGPEKLLSLRTLKSLVVSS